MKDFRELKVWQKSHYLTLNIYQATSQFPKTELHGLTSQSRRASIPANTAEGCGRATDGDFARFLQISMGSASELGYHLLLVHDLGFLSKPQHPKLHSDLTEIQRMLNAFIQKLKASS